MWYTGMENTADSGGANTGFRCATDLATPKAQKRVKKKVDRSALRSHEDSGAVDNYDGIAPPKEGGEGTATASPARPWPLQIGVATPEAVVVEETDATRAASLQQQREEERLHLERVANETLEESMERIEDHRHHIARLTRELWEVGCKC